MADKFQLAQKNRVGKSLRDAQKNKLMFYKGKDGKKKAAVTKEELGGLSLRDYLNKQQGKTRKKDTKKTTTTITKPPVKGTAKKSTTNIFKVKKGESKTKAADVQARKEKFKDKDINIAKFIKPSKFLRTNESKTKAADAKRKTTGRGLTVEGKGTPRKLSNEERRKQERLKRSFTAANQVKKGPGRDRAMERARKYMRKPLRGKLVDGPKAAERYAAYPNILFNEGGFVETRMNKNSKGKGAGAALKGMGKVIM